MDLRFSIRTSPVDASNKTYLSSTLAPFKFYLAIHGFYSGENQSKVTKNLLWLYRVVFLFCPMYILIRVSFHFSTVTFGFNLNFILLITYVVFSLQATIGTIFMIFLYVNDEIKKLEKIWIDYKLNAFVPCKCAPFVAYVPALYPTFFMAFNVFMFALQAAGIISSQNVELGIHFPAPYLLPILTPFVLFGWGSCQGIYIANVNRSRRLAGTVRFSFRVFIRSTSTPRKHAFFDRSPKFGVLVTKIAQYYCKSFLSSFLFRFASAKLRTKVHTGARV